MPYWYCVTSLEKRKIASQEIHGPFEDYKKLEKSIKQVSAEIREEGYIPVSIKFVLNTDDIPEIVT